jgi:hypothetical protein
MNQRGAARKEVSALAGWFHASVTSVQRSKGHAPMTAKAAYRAAEAIHDARTGETFDYTRKRGVLHTEIALPSPAPERLKDRACLWNEAEQGEKRKDSQVGRELQFAVPANVTRDEQIRIAREVATFVIARHGAAVDWALHAPHPEGDQRNFHVHMLISPRRVDANGFTEKMPELDNKWQSPASVEAMRAEVAAAINRSFERCGIAERVDHRSFEARGIDREPEQHLGPAANGKERRGETSRIGEFNRQAAQRNETRDELHRQAEVIDLAIAREKRRAAEAKKHLAQRRRWKEQDAAASLEDASARHARHVERERARFELWAEKKREDLARDHTQRNEAFAKETAAGNADLKDRIERATGDERRSAARQREEIERRQCAASVKRLWHRMTGQAERDRQALAGIAAKEAELDSRAERMTSWQRERTEMQRRGLDAAMKAEATALERRIAHAYARREADGWMEQRRRAKDTARQAANDHRQQGEAKRMPYRTGEDGRKEFVDPTEPVSPRQTVEGGRSAFEAAKAAADRNAAGNRPPTLREIRESRLVVPEEHRRDEPAGPEARPVSEWRRSAEERKTAHAARAASRGKDGPER